VSGLSAAGPSPHRIDRPSFGADGLGPFGAEHKVMQICQGEICIVLQGGGEAAHDIKAMAVLERLSYYAALGRHSI
jgi:hypothetical protein